MRDRLRASGTCAYRHGRRHPGDGVETTAIERAHAVLTPLFTRRRRAERLMNVAMQVLILNRSAGVMEASHGG